MNYNQENNNEKKLTIKQKLEIILNQFTDMRKVIIALIGLAFMPYLNQLLSNWKPIINFNNIYMKFLTMLGINNIPLVKDLSGNIILTIITYILILTIFLKPYLLQWKAEQCKALCITDNKRNTGNTIIPISERRNYKKGTITMKCFSNGIITKDFEENDNLERLSKKWNKYILDVCDYKKDKLKITYRKDKIENMIIWNNELLDYNDFKIVLGKDDVGNIRKFDFNMTPSMIIASASGGGKTTLFKSIMLQSYLKGATIIICDFKKGLDFNKGWTNLNNSRCKLITDYKTLWDYLEYDIHDIVNDRFYIINKYECSDVKEFNDLVDKGIIKENKIPRIIIGIDEASEIYIKSKNKDKEKLLNDIREKIDEVAHLYRAIGIHLIVSTQVPSAQVLTEQVRHNAFIKVCGRADKILSQIAIENENASTIKANERGRFATGGNDRYFFQGYLYNERKLLNEIIEKEKKDR